MRYETEFIKKMDRVASGYGRHEVFSDWLVLAGSSLYNSIHKDSEVEKSYLDIFKRYDKPSMGRMVELLSLTVEALEHEPTDFLGSVFQESEVSSKWGGQFFTPSSLSQIISALTLLDVDRKPGRVLRISEPACGSGGMVIAAFNQLEDEDKEWVHFVLQDVDVRCFYMAYIQLFLLGISAEVVLGNTLTMECRRNWKTFGYYALGMEMKLRMDELIEALSKSGSGSKEDASGENREDS